MYQDKITHEKIWDYLQKLAPYLKKDELETLSNLFKFMKQDYTPVQNFGDASLKFILEKERTPYIKHDIPSFSISDNNNEEIKQMLISFDEAKNHMETNELICITSVLSMIDENNFTITLVEENEKPVLKLFQQKNIDFQKKY